MAGRPLKHGRPKRPRRTTSKTDHEQRWLTSQWATAQTPTERLTVIGDTARALAADDRHGDTDKVNDLIDEAATTLRRQLRDVLNRRDRKGKP